MIELENVTLKAGGFSIEDVTFTIDAGDYAVLMGRTGSGKTTILEAVCGLRRVHAGTIRLHDKDITHLPPAKRDVGYVPQDLALFETMSVRQHLEFAPRLRRASPKEIAERVDELSSLLGIGYLLDRGIKGLSGGEAQRVALGRALSFHPPVLLLDEPMSALDDATRDEIYDLLRIVTDKTGVTTLHITHSRAEADTLGTRRFFIEDGAVIENT